MLLTGSQTVAGVKTFTNDIVTESVTPKIQINSTSGSGSLEYLLNDARTALAYSGISDSDGFYQIRTYLANGSTVGMSFTMYDNHAIFSKVCRGVTPVISSDFATKGYVDDNTNVVQQDSSWSMVMPTAAGTAGQQLEVGSVSGTVVTMVWV